MTLKLNRAGAALAGLVLLAASGASADTIVSSKGEEHLSAWITGYTYWDNTPPGSAAIARPVVHERAGGVGTWADPVTVAVGRSGGGWHYEPGTRLYLADLRKYAVVEDLCGACGGGRGGRVHIDIYVGGAATSAATASACAMKITAVQDIVVNPGPGRPVVAGELAEGCRVF